MINVIKRNGDTVPYNPERINTFLEFACDGLDVSASEIAINSKLFIYDGITTKDINAALIESAHNLIDEDNPDYAIAAGRILLCNIRKEVYGDFEPYDLLTIVKENTELGLYDPSILEKFTEDEINELDNHIDHSRDFLYSISGAREWESKYLLKNAVTKQFYESPQVSYMLVSMMYFIDDKGDGETSRIGFIKEMYDMLSLGYWNIPTPHLARLRTDTRAFSSCVLIEVGDSIDSISEAATAARKYATLGAGLGIGTSKLRSRGASIRGGRAINTGALYHSKSIEESALSCSQGQTRKGSLTFSWWGLHKDIEEALLYKNNMKKDSESMKHSDHTIFLNGFILDAARKDETLNLFSPEEAKEVYDSFYADDPGRFIKAYRDASENVSNKATINAREYMDTLISERSGTGRLYIGFADNIGRSSMYDVEKYPVTQSNLCVAPETLVLTDKGYIPIVDLEGQKVNVWNGHEWSNVEVVKTSESSKLVKVVTDSGYEIECTPYHKFYVQNGYNKEPEEVRAGELRAGDNLIKFTTPLVRGSKELDKAYINGFYSGDGCLTKDGQRVYLYHEKRKLKPLFGDGLKWYIQDNLNREYTHFDDLEDKFFVPLNDYTVQSRLDWLAGYADADGCIYRNGSNEQLVLNSINKDFLHSIQLMLQTLGVNSKIRLYQEEGMRIMPKNDGSGENGSFFCQNCYRLLISSGEFYKLQSLGIRFHRLKAHNNEPQRSAIRFVKVLDVIDEGRFDETYCFNEPLRHKGVFNGILTGQCVEIVLPTKALNRVYDSKSKTYKQEGLIALCNLGGVNWGAINSPDEFKRICYVGVRALDNILSYQEHPFPAAEEHNRLFRPLGVGITGLAYWIAKNDLSYSNCYELLDTWMQHFSHAIIDASCRLSEERGRCDGFEDTKWSKGILPMDLTTKFYNEWMPHVDKVDWDSLRARIMRYGVRNASLSALFPAETSARVSGSGTTNGVEPIRQLTIQKGGKNKQAMFVVPEIKWLKNKYDRVWDFKDNTALIRTYAVLQKYVDQAISANTYYSKNNYPNGKIPYSTIISDIFLHWALGGKTLYYNNNFDGQSQSFMDGKDILNSDVTIVSDMDNDCESCKL